MVSEDNDLHIALHQSYEGDVTIVPVQTLEDFLAVLHVPSKVLDLPPGITNISASHLTGCLF